MGSRCQSCKAHVEWVTTTAGKLMPLDLAPTANGNIVINEAGLAEVLGELEVRMLPSGTSRRTSHFATCPDATSFRREPAPRGRGRR